MKKMMCLGLVSLFSVAAFAKAPTPQAPCRAKHNGMTIAYTDGKKFFQALHEIAQKEKRCVWGKISYVENSGRIYSSTNNGVLLGSGVSNNEAEDIIRDARSKGTCSNLLKISCDEIDVVRPGESVVNEVIQQAPVIVLPSTGSGEY